MTRFCSSCTDGRSWTKTPSVTGRKPQVPYVPDADTANDASCSVVVFCATRHWKIVCDELPYAQVGAQPACVANA